MSAGATLDRIFASLGAIATSWQGEAGRRRQLTAVDPAADVLDHCASELRDQLTDLQDLAANLTVLDYARLEGVTPQTVRNWIRDGRLDAMRTANGYVISRHAKVQAVSA